MVCYKACKKTHPVSHLFSMQIVHLLVLHVCLSEFYATLSKETYEKHDIEGNKKIFKALRTSISVLPLSHTHDDIDEQIYN